MKCVVCEKPLTGKRTKFCSDECYNSRERMRPGKEVFYPDPNKKYKYQLHQSFKGAYRPQKSPSVQVAKRHRAV